MNSDSPNIFTGSEAIEIKIICELLEERPEFVTITIESKGENLKERYNLSKEGRNYIIEYAKGLLEKKEALSFPETEMNPDSPHIITGAEAKEIRKICELLEERPEFVTITIESKGENLKERYNLSKEGRNYIIEYAKGLFEKKEVPPAVQATNAKEGEKVKQLLRESPDFLTKTIEEGGRNLKERFLLSEDGRKKMVAYAKELADKKESETSSTTRHTDPKVPTTVDDKKEENLGSAGYDDYQLPIKSIQRIVFVAEVEDESSLHLWRDKGLFWCFAQCNPELMSATRNDDHKRNISHQIYAILAESKSTLMNVASDDLNKHCSDACFIFQTGNIARLEFEDGTKMKGDVVFGIAFTPPQGIKPWVCLIHLPRKIIPSSSFVVPKENGDLYIKHMN